MDQMSTAEVGPRAVGAEPAPPPELAGGGDKVTWRPPPLLRMSVVVSASPRMPATAQGTRAPEALRDERAGRSAAPHCVQYSSPAAVGAPQAGQGGPRSALPHREQKLAVGELSTCWHCGHNTPVADVILRAFRPRWR